MTAYHLPIAGFIDQDLPAIFTRLGKLVPAPKPAQVKVVHYSIRKPAAISHRVCFLSRSSSASCAA